MKHLLVTFLFLFGITHSTYSQHSIGGIAGVTLEPNMIGKLRKNFIFSVSSNPVHSYRIGVRGRFNIPNQIFSIETGYDRYNESFKIDIDSNFTITRYNYDLSYYQIPFLCNMDLIFDSNADWTPFFGAKYGLSADILISETINNIPNQETDFNKVVLNAVGGSYVGVQNEFIRIAGVFNAQLSANSIINNSVYNGGVRTFEMSFFVHAAFIF